MVVDSYLSGDPIQELLVRLYSNEVVLAGEVRGPEIKRRSYFKSAGCIKDIGYDQMGLLGKRH